MRGESLRQKFAAAIQHHDFIHYYNRIQSLKCYSQLRICYSFQIWQVQKPSIVNKLQLCAMLKLSVTLRNIVHAYDFGYDITVTISELHQLIRCPSEYCYDVTNLDANQDQLSCISNTTSNIHIYIHTHTHIHNTRTMNASRAR